MEGKRGSECLLKSVSNIDFNPKWTEQELDTDLIIYTVSVLKRSDS